MRRLFTVCLLLAISACHKQVVVPTFQELVANPQLLKEWQDKCSTGEYSHLSSLEKGEFCQSTRSASISLLQAQAAKEGQEMLEASAKRR